MKRDIAVLLLEDVPADADALTNTLREAQFDVQVQRVETREAFERALEQRRPDIIISDHGLPDFDGLSALSLARSRFPDIPFILVTGAPEGPMTREALRRGATDYVSKDRLQHIVPQVKQALSRAASEAECDRLERQLAETEDRYRVMIDHVIDYAIYMLDDQGNVASWNPGAERIEGYRAEEIIGRNFSIFFTPEDVKKGRPNQELDRARTEGRSESEAWSVRKDRSYFRSHWTLTAVRENGRVKGFVRVAHDVTQQHQTQEALRQSEEQLRMVLQSARDYAIITLGPDRRVTSWNTGAERIFGYTTQQALGLDFNQLFPPEWVEAGHVDTELQVAVENGYCGNESWHLRKGGERFWGSGQTVTLRDPKDNVRGFLKIVQDQTGRRLMESEIQAHVREQTALARFSERALAEVSPDSLAREALSVIAESLGMELCAWVEFVPKENVLRLREAVGWETELQQELTLKPGPQSQAGYTIAIGRPVVSDDLRIERRFQVPAPARQRGAISSLSVAVPGDPQPFGVLLAHSLWHRRFSEHEIHFVESVAHVLSHAIRRKRAEEALQKSEERFRLAVETVQDYAVYLLDSDGRIASWNLGAERMLGYKAQEVIGQPFSIFFAAEDVAEGQPEQELERARTHGRDRGQRWAVRKDGSRFYADWALTALRDHDMKVTGFIKVARDMTELLQTQEELRRSEERFRLAVEAVQEYAIYMLDADGRVATYNIGATRLEGYQPEEIIGRALRTFFSPEDVARGVPDQELERARTEGKSLREGWNVRKDGSRFLSNWLLTAVRDPGGQLTGYSKVARDVTELRKAEDKLRNWNAELEARVAQRTRDLEAANKELESFSYTVSHDLRAPLRHISAFIALLRRTLGPGVSEDARQHLEAVTRSAGYMGQLVDDLLAFSRLGRQEMRRVPIRLTDLIHEARAQLQPEMEGRDIEWVIGSCPGIEGDPVTLRQVFVNLLSNALKYTSRRPRARIEIGCSETATEIICCVRDNGVGFDMRFANKLFGVFQRLHTAREFEGTGIGLATVRRIIQRHGGRTWAEGQVDHGATFYFSLPKSAPQTFV